MMKKTLLLVLIGIFSLSTLSAQNLIKTKFTELAKELDATYKEVPANPTWKNKVGPYLLKASYQQPLYKAKAANGIDFIPEIQMNEKNGVLRSKVFIKMSSGQDPNGIPGFEPILVLPSGTIATGWLTLNSLPMIASNPNVLKIEASKFSYLKNGEANRLSKADQVHAGAGGLSQAYTGKGVIVGVIDSGIDFTADDFKDENGSRILALVDMLADDTDVVYSKEEIDSNPELVLQRDGVGGGGHGTHVTGTAAGNGAGNDAYKGVAYEADIVFIKGIRDPDSNGGFGDADIVDGINFIFEGATGMGKPAVVNLSLGSNSGPLDGTSLYEQAITELQEGPGKIIVAAAGNEGFDYLHTGTEISAGVNYVTLEYANDPASLAKEIWYDQGVISHFAVSAMQQDENGALMAVASSDFIPVTGDNYDSPLILTLAGTETGVAELLFDATNTEDANNGDGQLYIQISQNDETQDLQNYFWAVFYRTGEGSGRFDAISTNGSAVTSELEFDGFTYLVGERDRSIGSPASAKDIISVGAYVSTTSWTADNGQTYSTEYGVDFYYEEVYTPQTGEIAEFSSRGPTRDGRLSPIVSAPGDQIFSVRSSHIPDEILGESKLVGGGKYMGMQGTSMATPHITGIIALMLEANPSLTYEQVAGIFSSTSTPDAFTQTLPNNIFGVGKADALASVLMAAATATSVENEDGFLPATFKLDQNYPNPFNPTTTISFDLPVSTQVQLTIYDMLGQQVQVLEQGFLTAGRYVRNFNASALPTGIYIYRLQGANFSATKKMTLLK